jgi:signal transduction histidine kinase
MSQPIRVLIIEDSKDDAFFLIKHLEKHGYTPKWERIDSAVALQTSLQTKSWDVILSDFKMPTFNGLEALEILKDSGLDIPFIIVSGTIGEEVAVAAMKGGASDYILKGNLQRLGPAIERELQEAHNRAERQKAEEALKLYMKRLEQSNKELEQFALVASHDLQEPLRKIRIFSEYLRSSQEEKLTKEGLLYLEHIQSAAARMQNLISDLLDLSRVNRKGHAFQKIDLANVVSSVAQDFDFALKEKQGKIELGQLCTIEADPKQMTQLFLNLVGNSLKFQREDVPPLVKISAQVADGCCEILVEDNGIGFEEQYQERIFNVFERLHSRAKYAGTGIGLAICKKIAERHGGTIQAHGKPNEGATFIIKLPVKPAV